MVNETRVRRVVAEYDGDGWLVMWPSGAVDRYDTADDVLAAELRRARRGNRTVTFSRLEWRNVPAGFVPPTGDRERGTR